MMITYREESELAKKLLGYEACVYVRDMRHDYNGIESLI